MNFEKLSSGSYRVRKTINGITYRVSFPYKPTISEAELRISQEVKNQKAIDVKGSFYDNAQKYISSKSNILSPSTIRGYKNILKHIPEDFASKQLYRIDKLMVQNVVNDYAQEHSAKSTINFSSFIVAVIKMFTDVKFCITLPQKQKQIIQLPSREDISALAKSFEGTPLEIILRLACYGLRRGELFAITLYDILDVQILVNLELFKNDIGNWLLKITKTVESTRIVSVSKVLTDKIKALGSIYGAYTPDSYDKVMRRKMVELGIKPFGIHKLRHFYASLMHSLAIPDAYIQQQGGWSSNRIMHSVYTHTDSKKAEEFYNYSNAVIEEIFQ